VWQLRGRYPNRGYPKIFEDKTVRHAQLCAVVLARASRRRPTLVFHTVPFLWRMSAPRAAAVPQHALSGRYHLCI
jgi:hypothetical protein